MKEEVIVFVKSDVVSRELGDRKKQVFDAMPSEHFGEAVTTEWSRIQVK